MKFELAQPTFSPVVITLESEEEARAVLTAIRGNNIPAADQLLINSLDTQLYSAIFPAAKA